jgi:hypothetical protein
MVHFRKKIVTLIIVSAQALLLAVDHLLLGRVARAHRGLCLSSLYDGEGQHREEHQRFDGGHREYKREQVERGRRSGICISHRSRYCRSSGKEGNKDNIFVG